jgi:putative iron-dependent peroxidase
MNGQPGILAQPESHAVFLVLRVRDPIAAAAVAATVPKRVQALAREAKTAATVSFGSEMWDAIWPRRPRELHPFRAMAMDGRAAPSTGGDLFLHVSSKRADLAFELARDFKNALEGAVVLEEVIGFRYRDSRDLTGFVDGTENPKGKERGPAALIGEEDPEFAGGSYVFTQRYVHDLSRWNRIETAEQEGIVGRTKKHDKELSDAKKPPTAHIARTVIEENGEELQIVRHSMPYGTTTEAGLFFVAYMRRFEIVEHMLRRMIGATDDGLYDRLLEFTKAVTGAHFFAPAVPMLRELGESKKKRFTKKP